jgi:hypothetical protein
MIDSGDQENGDETIGDSQDMESAWEGLPDLNKLPEIVLARIVRGDAKGRAFGSPRNPRMPTIAEFNPRIRDIRAGDLANVITGRMHPENAKQAASVKQLSNADLVRFRLEDPISAVESRGSLSLRGGHHRTAEIIRRVQSGLLSPDSTIKVLIHD